MIESDLLEFHVKIQAGTTIARFSREYLVYGNWVSSFNVSLFVLDLIKMKMAGTLQRSSHVSDMNDHYHKNDNGYWINIIIEKDNNENNINCYDCYNIAWNRNDDRIFSDFQDIVSHEVYHSRSTL